MTIVAVLLVSAIGTTNVYADDGPPVEPVETETAPAEDGAPETPPTEGEPVTAETEVPAVEGEAVATEPAVEPTADGEEQLPAEVEMEVAPLLEQVPENTTVTVLNSEGEAQPLISQDSAEAIIVSDPIWCPEGQDPTPGANGCTESFSSFDALLTHLQLHEGDYGQAGVIYVQEDLYTGPEESIDFNLYNFQTINNFNLTVTGGWNTTTGSVDSTTQLHVPLVIGSSETPWGGSLTINNISISDVYGGTGLTLFSQEDIVLEYVDVTNSHDGAELDAVGNVEVYDSTFNNNKQTGAVIRAGGYVDVMYSEFNDNGVDSKHDGSGLEIDSQDEVFLHQVTAIGNEKFGADIDADGQVTVQYSVFSGNVSYSYSSCGHPTTSGGYGLKVVTEGAVKLETVEANDNYLFGAHVEGAEVEVLNSFFSHNGSGSLDKPKGYGLEVISTAGVTLMSVEANNNQLFGANIQAVNNVTVNDSFFSGNKSYKYSSCQGKTYYGYGLQVVTTGDVGLSNVSANENYLWGARLKGERVSVADAFFSNNGNGSSKTLTGRGLEVEGVTQVSLTNVEASNNQSFGASILTGGDVAVVNSYFSGHKVYSYSCQGEQTLAGGGYGLKVVTDGIVVLTNVEASDNYLYGAQLDGSEVAITDGFFNNNKEGLYVHSDGAASLSGVEANNNKRYGATVDAGGAVTVSNSFFNGNLSYTSSSCQGKTYYGYGLKVVTTDFVGLTGVTAEGNYLYGAHVEGADMSITSSSFSNNGTGVQSDHIGKGLEVDSTGQVTLRDVVASNNQLFGANIAADSFVFVTNSIFNGNKSYTSSCSCKTYDGYGLQVVTTSEIYLDGVTANENYLWGAHLEGSYVQVTGSSFNLNRSPEDKNATGRGLEIESTGDALLQFVEANNNQLFGANIQAEGVVTVLTSVFAGNQYSYYSCQGTKHGGYGLKVAAVGEILVGSSPDAPGVGVMAYENGAEGAILDGESTVEVWDSSFYDNGADGAVIDGDSTVEVRDSSFENNGKSGLVITADGDVTLTNVVASGNEVDGVKVTGACTNFVYVNGGTFADNGRYGIKVIDATYTPDGAQVFANNHSGDVFTDSSTCIVNVESNESTEEENNSAASDNNSNNNHGWWNWWHWYWHHH